MKERNCWPRFYAPFIWMAFALSLLGGFGLAGHLSFVIGYGYALDASIAVLMQVHGHVQLIGWVGLMLMGISIHVIPRLYGVQRISRRAPIFICWAMTFGVVLRFVAPILGTYLNAETEYFAWGRVLSYFWFVGALLQCLAVTFYVGVIGRCLASAAARKIEKKRLVPYFFPMLLGWVVYLFGSLALVVQAKNSGVFLLDGWWSSFLTDVFVRLTLISAVLGFGVKMIPVFLGLRSPLWPVGRIGYLYSTCTISYLLFRMLRVQFDLFPQLTEILISLALIGMSIALLLYIWQLDALLFRELPQRIVEKMKRSDIPAHRGRMNDRGEYGHFEWFIIFGFGWATFLALAELSNGLTMLLSLNQPFSQLHLRHVLLLGFITQIVFGVGYRLLPQLLGRRLMSGVLVDLSFFLLAASTVCRLAPELLLKLGIVTPSDIYGLSGSIAALALLSFAVNLGFGKKQAQLRDALL
jgi:uncharacterized protein involved in response to NO